MDGLLIVPLNDYLESFAPKIDDKEMSTQAYSAM